MNNSEKIHSRSKHAPGETSASTKDESASWSHDQDSVWQIGNTILGTYVVTDFLGQGGMGKVFRVKHLGWNIDMAVKLLKPNLLTNPLAVESFQQECETWVNLGLHPHVVSCYYVRVIDGTPKVFAEYVDGGSLRRWITEGKLYEGGQKMALRRILTIAIQTAWGLHHAHQNGLVHRDVKTGNILISRSSGAKVTDFGLAGARISAAHLENSARESDLVSAGGMTPAYCSPEQFRREKVSYKTDIWSWALSVLEMFVGGVTWKRGPEAPSVMCSLYEKGPVFAYCPPMPERVYDVLLKCCQEEPAARPKDMLEVVESLKEIYHELVGKPFPHRSLRPIRMRADSSNNRAVSLIDLGKWEDAEKAWCDALKAEPKHTEATFNFGLVKWRSGRLHDEGLLQELQEVRRLHPSESLPFVLYNQVLLERGDYEEVLKNVNRLETSGQYSENWLSIKQQAIELLPYTRKLVRTFCAHKDAITSVAVTRTGRLILSGSHDNTVIVWDTQSGTPCYFLTGHQGSVTRVGLSLNEKIAVSCSSDRTVRTWELDSGECIRVLKKHNACVVGVHVFDDSGSVLSCGQDGLIVHQSLEDGSIESLSLENRSSVAAFSFCAKGKLLFLGHVDGQITVWSYPEGVRKAAWKAHDAPIRSLAADIHSNVLLSGSDDGKMKVWDKNTFACRHIFDAHLEGVLDVHLFAKSPFAASSGKDGAVRLWCLRNRRCLYTYRGHRGAARCVMFTADARYLISGGEDGLLNLWSVGSVIPKYRAPFVLCRAIEGETAVKDEMTFVHLLNKAKGCFDKADWNSAADSLRAARELPGFRRNARALALWSALYTKLPRGEFVGSWRVGRACAHKGAATCLAVAPDGATLFSAGEDGSIVGWDPENCTQKIRFEGHTKPVKALDVDPLNRFLLSAGEDNVVMAWDIRSGKLLKSFEPPAGSIDAVAVSPNGQFIVGGGWALTLWHVDTGRCLLDAEVDSGSILSLAWTPDSCYVITATSEELVQIWDMSQLECVHALQTGTGCVAAIKISADGKFLMTGNRPLWGHQGRLMLWDMQDLKPVFSEEAHRGGINTVSLSVNARIGLTGGQDNTVRLWDFQDRACLQVLSETTPNVRAVVLSPECRFAAAADEQGNIEIWYLDWSLLPQPSHDWDDGALPYIHAFLSNRRLSEKGTSDSQNIRFEDVRRFFRYRGKPSWTDKEVERLLFLLGCAGYGWLSRERVLKALAQESSKKAFGWF